MNGSHLIALLILSFGIMPNLGFFSLPAFFILVLFLLFILFVFLKKDYFQGNSFNPDFISILLLVYSAYYYGGLYQPPALKIIGQCFFFILIIYLFIWKVMLKKQVFFFLILLSYVGLALWTLYTSPHPHVDTVVVFKEAPMMLLHGKNPYSSLFSQVYPNIKPDYYNHLPLSFIFYIPFLFLPVDQRVALVIVTVLSFLFLYKLVKPGFRQKSLLPLSLVLFMPGSFYMLEHMYHETIIFFFFTLAVFTYSFSQKGFYFFLSLFFSIKQNMLLMLPMYLKKILWKNKNWVIFFAPFLLIIFFLLWNPKAFIEDVFLGLTPGKVTSPIQMSLALATFLTHAFSHINKQILYGFCSVVFMVYYVLVLINRVLSNSQKTVLIIFGTYFFSYYGFFNSYYLVLLFLLYDYIKIYYFPKKLILKLS